VPTVELLFAMLARGRVDVVLANDSVGYALARRYVDARIRPAEKPTGTDVYYLGLSRKSPAVELLPRINEILIELRREGVIDTLMKPR
jgi:ABC-type amino acid transport substrate-binding protein